MATKQNEHKILARMKEGMAEVKLLLRHPMETGNRTDPRTGVKVPRHFIRDLVCEHNGDAVFSTQWSWGMARNPYLSFRIRDAKPGDRVLFRWSDNRGDANAVETIVQ